jgi:hypothetical protein
MSALEFLKWFSGNSSATGQLSFTATVLPVALCVQQ